MERYKNFVALLSAAVQKGLFYKHSHPETVKSIESCFSVMDKLFQEKSRIVVIFNSDSVFVNFELVKSNQHMVDFMYKFLSERSFSGLLFDKNISLSEFSTFLQIIADSKGKAFADIDADLGSYNVKFGKILFYRPSMGGSGTGTGSGSGSGGPSAESIYDPETGRGSFVVLSSDIRQKLIAGMSDVPGEIERDKAAPEQKPRERNVTAKLTDEEVLAVI